MTVKTKITARWIQIARLLTLTLAVLCTSACNDTPAPSTAAAPAVQLPKGSIPDRPASFETLITGLQTPGISVDLVGQGEDALLLLTLDASALEPVLIGRPRRGTSAQAALRDNGFSAVIGSGFVSDLNSLEPVGLLHVNGQTLSPVQGYGYTRILGINDQGLGVVHRSAYESALFHSALQAGPGIVEQGKLDISRRDLERPKYFRSFVAVCAERWLVGVSLRPAHLRTLGETLLAHIQSTDTSCDEVVNLAGDRQAVLVVKNGNDGVLFHGDPDTYKVSLLGFRPL